MENFAPNTRFISDNTLNNIANTIKKYSRYKGLKKVTEYPDIIRNIKPDYDNCGFLLGSIYGRYGDDRRFFFKPSFNVKNIFDSSYNKFIPFTYNNIDFNKVLYDPDYIVHFDYSGLNNVKFPNELSYLPSYYVGTDAFRDCKNLDVGDFTLDPTYMNNMFNNVTFSNAYIPYIGPKSFQCDNTFYNAKNLNGYAYFDIEFPKIYYSMHESLISSGNRTWSIMPHNVFNKNTLFMFNKSEGLEGIVLDYSKTNINVENVKKYNLSMKNFPTDYNIRLDIYNLITNDIIFKSTSSTNSYKDGSGQNVVGYSIDAIKSFLYNTWCNYERYENYIFGGGRTYLTDVMYPYYNYLMFYESILRNEIINVFDPNTKDFNVVLIGTNHITPYQLYSIAENTYFNCYNIPSSDFNKSIVETDDIIHIKTRNSTGVYEFDHKPKYKVSYNNIYNFYWGYR